jgi:ferritin-like metal-binding protein YciE
VVLKRRRRLFGSNPQQMGRTPPIRAPIRRRMERSRPLKRCPVMCNRASAPDQEITMTMKDNTTRMDPSKKSAAKSSDAKGLADLFEHGLKDMYYAEKKILRSLPKMIKAAQDPDLKQALESHRDETMTHIDTLETVFDMISKRAKAEKCDAIDGILEEATSLLEDFGGSETGDAAIVFSAQAVEHYEITRYGSLVAFAKALGLKDAATELKRVLDQEYAADKKLSGMAETGINRAAA